jgi:hypothetical protein
MGITELHYEISLSRGVGILPAWDQQWEINNGRSTMGDHQQNSATSANDVSR